MASGIESAAEGLAGVDNGESAGIQASGLPNSATQQEKRTTAFPIAD